MRRMSQRLCETCGQQGQVMGRTECYMMRLSDPLVLCTSSVSATGEGVWECAGDTRALESSKSLLHVAHPRKVHAVWRVSLVPFYWRRAACGSSGLSAPSSSSAARHVRPWRRAWVVNREELFAMIHRIRSYAVVGSRNAQEKQTSSPQNSMRAPRSSPCKQPFTGPSRTRTLRSFALAKSPVRLTSSPKLIGCESSASLSAPTRFGAMQREQAAPHALS